MRQSILFGNGINRLSGEMYKWENLLMVNGTEKTLAKEVTPTHRFDDILINHKKLKEDNYVPHDESALKKFCLDYLDNLKLNDVSNNIYHRLWEIGADHYLTTNYDGSFEKFIQETGYRKNSRTSSDSINLHRRYTYSKGDSHITFWPIHGDFNKPNTMMFGYDHYCLSVSALCHYLEFGKTREDGYWNKNDHKDDLTRFLNWREINNVKGHYPYIQYRIQNFSAFPNFCFWADLFFFSDVHILGIGMDLAESDLWCILNRRARLLQNTNLKPYIKNNIYVYGYFDEHIFDLLDSYGVITKYAQVGPLKEITSEEWAALYSKSIDHIQANVNLRRK
ncbi:MAG: SIR2 family protein [Bacteroidaceae bacterium]|nr:SIR2 family protein [Bacteroidaceae bacterium]